MAALTIPTNTNGGVYENYTPTPNSVKNVRVVERDTFCPFLQMIFIINKSALYNDSTLIRYHLHRVVVVVVVVVVEVVVDYLA